VQIHDLILAGDVSGLEEFLQAQTNVAEVVNKADQWRNQTPLFAAVQQRPVSHAVVRLLLEAGADPNFVSVQSLSSIAMGDNLEIIEDLDEAHIESPTEFRMSIVSQMLRAGDLALVKLFEEHGADLLSTDSDGYTPILHAIYVLNEPVEVVDYLLSLGVSPDTKSIHGETAIVGAMRNGHFKTVARLVSAGVDEAPIAWSPLIRATAVGTAIDVNLELSNAPDLEATDSTGCTALQVALKRGHEAILELLLNAGASVETDTGNGNSPLLFAVEGGSSSLVLRMLRAGCTVDEDSTPLETAVESGNIEIVRILLEHGANPTKGDIYDSIVSKAKDTQTLLLLLNAGSDPAEVKALGRRTLVGLPRPNNAPLASITQEQYMQARYERPGRTNPEDLTEPFRLAMIQSGSSAYAPRVRFDDMPDFACHLSWSERSPQVWCFDRFGQSFTQIPDGRIIMVGGEHEDYYDPDFCIYNDVTVFYPDGQVRLFGYPYEVFEPTDFHTATLVDNFIWIIGGVGYTDQRDGAVPVYRLNVSDYSIERISTLGDVPTRFHGHRAILCDGGEIEITAATTCGLGAEQDELSTLRFDTSTRTWTRQI